MQYMTITLRHGLATVEVSRFTGSGGVSEYHIIARPTQHADISTQLRWLRDAYSTARDELDLASSTVVFRRFFCSDLVNQAPALTASGWASGNTDGDGCAVSWTDQSPLTPAKVALWAYHVVDPAGKLRKYGDEGKLRLQRGGLAHCWSVGMQSVSAASSYEQTRSLFQEYDDVLRTQSLSLAGNVVRTWLFVRDIDNNYQGLVVARRKHFAENGLTPKTHFIASSGIGGGSPDPAALVTIDAYAIAGLQAGQVEYLSAPEHLGPTSAYGVTFERGTLVSYRDRKHIIISGTASIDPDGRIVHPGNVARQLERTMENVEALLSSAGATLRDTNHLIVYVRDPSDHAWAQQAMRERVGTAPLQVVRAQVCRPGWLVEIEGMACIPHKAPGLPEF